MCDFDLKIHLSKNYLMEPTVFHQLSSVTKWPFTSMTFDKLANILKEKKLKFRIGKHVSSNVQWEGQCQFIQATLAEFINWINLIEDTGLLAKFDKDSHWAYADYIYIQDLFNNVNDYNVFEEIDWTTLGYNKSEGKDMAIWIGSKGAYTVCHYDSYGYNLVFQVCGRKRWILFSPEDADFMYPTRIPYEESTVFSKVNITKPDIAKHQKFISTHPYVVVLEPGDLLFVPSHWWHFVENLDEAISINAWFPHKNDPVHRVNEAITRLLIGSALYYQLPDAADLASEIRSSWINPTESATPNLDENLLFLNRALAATDSTCKKSNPSVKESFATSSKQCSCSSSCQCSFKNVNCTIVQSYCFKHACQIVDYWKDLLHESEDAMEPKANKYLRSNDAVPTRDHRLTWKNVVECCTKPTVINCIRSELEKSLNL